MIIYVYTSFFKRVQRNDTFCHENLEVKSQNGKNRRIGTSHDGIHETLKFPAGHRF